MSITSANRRIYQINVADPTLLNNMQIGFCTSTGEEGPRDLWCAKSSSGELKYFANNYLPIFTTQLGFAELSGTAPNLSIVATDIIIGNASEFGGCDDILIGGTVTPDVDIGSVKIGNSTTVVDGGVVVGNVSYCGTGSVLFGNSINGASIENLVAVGDYVNPEVTSYTTPTKVTSVGNSNFNGCVFNASTSADINIGYGNFNNANATLGKNVTVIGNTNFSDSKTTNVTNSLIIGNNINATNSASYIVTSASDEKASPFDNKIILADGIGVPHFVSLKNSSYSKSFINSTTHVSGAVAQNYTQYLVSLPPEVGTVLNIDLSVSPICDIACDGSGFGNAGYQAEGFFISAAVIPGIEFDIFIHRKHTEVASSICTLDDYYNSIAFEFYVSPSCMDLNKFSTTSCRLIYMGTVSDLYGTVGGLHFHGIVEKGSRLNYGHSAQSQPTVYLYGERYENDLGAAYPARMRFGRNS